MRFEKLRGVVILCVMTISVFLGGYFVGQRNTSVVHAQTASSTVPKSWGKLVGALGQYLIFEDAGGVIRIVDVQSGQLEGQVSRK